MATALTTSEAIVDDPVATSSTRQELGQHQSIPDLMKDALSQMPVFSKLLSVIRLSSCIFYINLSITHQGRAQGL